jgi:hypothetical protein
VEIDDDGRRWHRYVWDGIPWHQRDLLARLSLSISRHRDIDNDQMLSWVEKIGESHEIDSEEAGRVRNDRD